MKAKMVAFILLTVLLALAATPVYAQGAPELPHAFYGTIEVNGSPAPVGTQVEARGEGVRTSIGDNPVVITVEGQYGSSGTFDPKLIVQGEIAEGTTVTFYVNGVSTGKTTEWHSGWVTELNIDATVEGSLPEPPPLEETTEPPPGETTEPPPEETTEPPPEETTEPPPESTEPSPEATEPPSEGGEPPSEAPLLPPPPPTESGEFPVLWAVIGGMVVVGLIIFAVTRRRAY